MHKNTENLVSKKTRVPPSVKENKKGNERVPEVKEEEKSQKGGPIPKPNVIDVELSEEEEVIELFRRKSPCPSEKKVKKNIEETPNKTKSGAKASKVKDNWLSAEFAYCKEENERETSTSFENQEAKMGRVRETHDKAERNDLKGRPSVLGFKKGAGSMDVPREQVPKGTILRGGSSSLNDKKKGEIENNLAMEIDMSSQALTEEDMKLPYWLEPANMKDANGRKPTEEDYDPSTILIPILEYNKLKGTKKQYWDIKRKNFDKIVIFKTWKFYYIFGLDAVVAHRLCNIRLTQARGNELLQVFFHESRLEQIATELVEGGQKVIVVEQMEGFNEGKEAVMRREVTQVITRGTATDLELSDFESKYTLCVFEKEEHFYGVTFFDATTHEFFMDQFRDDENMTLLRSLVTRIRPVEVVCVVGFCSNGTLKLIKAIGNPQITNFRLRYFPQIAWMFQEMLKVFQVKTKKNLDSESSHPLSDLREFANEALQGNNRALFPKYLAELLQSQSSQALALERENSNGTQHRESELNGRLIVHSLYACFIYLQSILLADTVFRFGDFNHFDVELQRASGGSYMVLDAHTISNLDLLEPPSMTHLSKSPEFNAMRSMYPSHDLLSVLDHAVTGYGKRMLKKWLLYPSKDVEVIRNRQDAIQDLLNCPEVANRFQSRLGDLQDIERSVNRIYNLANKQRLDGVYFENYQQERLKDFYNLVQKLKKVESILVLFEENDVKMSSERLRRLTTFQPDENISARQIRKTVAGMFPRVSETLKRFEGMIKKDESDRLSPANGVSEPYDSVCMKMRLLSERIAVWTEEQRKRFRSSEAKNINVSRGAKGYEIEIPEELLKGGNKMGSDFIVTSKRKGFSKFMNGFLEELTVEERRITDMFKEALVPFLLQIFTEFHKENSKWRQMISCLAEIDTLCSLASACKEWKVRCRPIIRPLVSYFSEGMEVEKPKRTFKLQGILHPCMKAFKKDYVANDIVFDEGKSILMVTGPNMGGKSTVLREACLALVLGQMGCMVPASYFEFSVCDRIFTRIGASDRILEGKSTFFIEMEETLNIVKDATPNSFVIMDELGRGTSTFDGLAIASSVLKEIIQNTRCFTLFSTHYHSLIDDFKLAKEVDFFMMNSELDPAFGTIRFLYKFVKGHVGRSFGLQVAKLAGIPEDLLEIADKHSEDLHRVKKTIDAHQELNARFNSVIESILNLCP